MKMALAVVVNLLNFRLHGIGEMLSTLTTSLGTKMERIWSTSESFRRRCSPPGRRTLLMLRDAF